MKLCHFCLLCLSFHSLCRFCWQKILAYTKGISVKSQGRYVDVVKAHQDIESIKSTLKSQIYSWWISWYCVRWSTSPDSVGVQKSSPRLASRQQHRSSGTVKEYKLNLLLDYIILELDSCFDSESSTIVVEFMNLLPSLLDDNTKLMGEVGMAVQKVYEQARFTVVG